MRSYLLLGRAGCLSVAMMVSITIEAKTIIRCSEPESRTVIITLDDHRAFGKMLNCISGFFISDMTPCAPTNGYGISASTGEAPLVAAISRFADLTEYADHPVVSSKRSEDIIAFQGGFNGETYLPSWIFSVSRYSGSAYLQQKNKRDINYLCSMSSPRS